MLVETKRMMPITRLQKELTQTVRELSDSQDEVYILKNNNMEAVLLSFSEFEYLKNLAELFERFEIKDMLQTRMQGYDPGKNVSWEALKARQP